MKFEQYKINTALKKSLAELGFKRPTDIQYKAIPHILKGEDVLAIAQTGTGKTAAFAIPLLDMLMRRKNSNHHAPEVIVMVPTRELGLQIEEAINEIAKYTNIRSLAIFGGVEQDPQIEKLKAGVDLVIATPGRMFDLQAQGHLDLKSIKVLVLDEADHMLKLGFYQDIQDLLKRLPQERQTLFFSATIDKKIKKLAYSLVNKPIRIQISPKDPVNKNIDHSVCFVEMEDKRFFLERIHKENPERKILAFVRTKVRAERVLKAMEKANIEAMALHGDKDQKLRIKTLDAFRKGDFRLLIATDVSARGIDIPDVEVVINYDLPDIAENYVHRVGRTGRAQKKGKAIAFCSPREEELLAEIEDYLGQRIKILEIDPQDYEETIDLSDSHLYSFKDVMRELQLEEESKKKKRKKKK
jgi:ATP-dependent RNA helicase RhlE